MRTCVDCGLTKSIHEFSSTGTRGYRFRTCKPCRATRYRERRDPVAARNAKLRMLYGISSEEYEAMLLAQGGGCSICGKQPPPFLFVDHNHSTGQVRALLCHLCNTLIGMSGENPILLRRAADYVEEHLGHGKEKSETQEKNASP